MNTVRKFAAGLALSCLCLAAYAQTAPTPQEGRKADRKMMDDKMKSGKMQDMKMPKDRMAKGKMKKDKMAGDKMEPKM